jgi:hypothetical protein
MMFKHSVLAMLVACAGVAHSAPVTVDFEGFVAGDVFTDNAYSQGLVISARCHYDISSTYNSGTSAPFGNWFGTDNAGCFGPLPGAKRNADYLGPGGPGSGAAQVYVARTDGGRFNFDSFVFASVTNGVGSISIRSEGGQLGTFASSSGNFTKHVVTGSEWRNLPWLLFDVDAPGAPVGFDNLQVTYVPEPSSAWLCAMGLLLLGSSLRKSRRA